MVVHLFQVGHLQGTYNAVTKKWELDVIAMKAKLVANGLREKMKKMDTEKKAMEVEEAVVGVPPEEKVFTIVRQEVQRQLKNMKKEKPKPQPRQRQQQKKKKKRHMHDVARMGCQKEHTVEVEGRL